MTKLSPNATEREMHRQSRCKTLVMGVRAYERMRLRPEAERVIIVDPQLQPTHCHRLSHRELLVGGLTFALELAGNEAVLFDVEQ